MVKSYGLRLAGIPTTILLLLFFASCTGGATPAAERLTVPQPTSAVPAGWQQELDKTLAEARKERSLTIYSSAGAVVRDGVTTAFQDKYGVSVDWVLGPSASITEKVLAEQRAGLYMADVYLSGVSALVFSDQKATESLDSVLFLPEVLDKKAWWGGDLLFLDKERSWVALQAFPQPPVLVSTDLVKPGEVTSWQGLLDPKWKGKMTLYNPRTGAGLAWAYHVSEVIMSRQYLYDFAKQEPVITDNGRQHIEWVARGKYPIAVATRAENANEFINLGSPVRMVTPEEGTWLTSGAGGLSVFRNPPHPNAAKLFINWALGREGGTVMSKLIGGQSARLDVATDFLDSSYVRQPGAKYFNTITLENTQKKEAFAKTAVEVFAPLMK